VASVLAVVVALVVVGKVSEPSVAYSIQVAHKELVELVAFL